jgi:hypothetical protein
MSSNTEDTIEPIEMAPPAPQPKRTESSSHLKVPRRGDEDLSTHREGGRPPCNNGSDHEPFGTREGEYKSEWVLTDLVKSLLRTVEEQKEEHANQLGTLTKTFSQQIETLKAQSLGNDGEDRDPVV